MTEEKSGADSIFGKNLCFPMYACAKEVVRKHKAYLEELDLTYTQYIVMRVLWEKGEVTVKTLGEYLYLDSGTLTPVLKKLEAKGYLTRKRSRDDERVLVIELTQEGGRLKNNGMRVPEMVGHCVELTSEEAETLRKLLYKVLDQV